MFDVCTRGDKAHIDTIFKLLSHTLQHVDAFYQPGRDKSDHQSTCRMWFLNPKRARGKHQKEKEFAWDFPASDLSSYVKTQSESTRCGVAGDTMLCPYISWVANTCRRFVN